MKLFKKIVGMFLSLVLIMNATSMFTINIFAFGANSNFAGENYKVDYFVKDSWGNNQIIEVKLTNTGTNNIENWALRFRADGEIKDLWNAKLNKHEVYII